jgi:hypothetical protein
VREQNASGEREQSGAVMVDRDNALRGEGHRLANRESRSRTGLSWRRLGSRARAPERVCKNGIELALAFPGRKDFHRRQSCVPWRDGVLTRSGAKGSQRLGLDLSRQAPAWLRVWVRAHACARRHPSHGGGPERRRRGHGDNTTSAACHSDGTKKGEQ